MDEWEWNGWVDGWREIVGMGGEDLYSGMGKKEIFFFKKKNLLEREDGGFLF